MIMMMIIIITIIISGPLYLQPFSLHPQVRRQRFSSLSEMQSFCERVDIDGWVRRGPKQIFWVRPSKFPRSGLGFWAAGFQGGEFCRP